jgi:tetratricopeptide (TPR) repeat protein
VTFRSASGDFYRIGPGHVVDITVEKRWLWLGADYASGTIQSARIDIAKLGLEPLPLDGGELEDIREYSDPCAEDDPYAPIWNALTAKPRPAFEFDGIAWGNLPGCDDPDDNPTCQAAELRELGRDDEAHALLMDALGTDLRCLDAHAHLGNALFDREPGRAIAHYEIGMRIGELSLPANVDALLPWTSLYNRPFLRCVHGYGLCLWRLGRFSEAQKAFERILSFNPDDHQGARFCLYDVRERRSWEEMNPREG